MAFSLTARLQAASIQPSVPDCAVLPDSTLSRVGVPSLLTSLAEEGLATSFTERDSFGDVNDRGEVQLARPGESNIAERSFLRGDGVGGVVESGTVMGADLLGELIQGHDSPLVPMLSGSDSFSPSAFMNIDAGGDISTFGGVNQYGDTRPMKLRSRGDLSVPGRYLHPTTPAKAKRGSKRVGDVRVKLFLADNARLNLYCGGKVGKGSNMQVCVAAASACHVTSHATKAESFEGDYLFIRTPVKAGRTTIYLDPSVSVETLSKAAVNYLLSLEFPVKF